MTRPVEVDAVLAHARRVTGRGFASRDVAVMHRDGFSVVRLATDLMAFVADDDAARASLARQRRVLARIAPRLSFGVPAPVGDLELEHDIDLRICVAGATGPQPHARMVEDPALLRRAAAWMGATLAELHGSLAGLELDALALPQPGWPQPLGQLRAGVDAHLEGGARDEARALAEEWHARMARSPARADVLVHADFGSHNFAFDEASGMPIGLFDFHDAGRRPRAFDFKFLPSYGEEALGIAVDAYNRRSGQPLSLDDVRLTHAATALSYLAWRAEDPDAHDRHSGRDRAGAIRWALDAMRAVGD